MYHSEMQQMWFTEREREGEGGIVSEEEVQMVHPSSVSPFPLLLQGYLSLG